MNNFPERARISRNGSTLTGLFAVGVLTIGFAGPAFAEGQLSSDTGLALSRLTPVSNTQASKVLSDVAPVMVGTSGDTAIDATVAGINVLVPTNPSDPISLESSSGQSISIDLPFSGVADDGVFVTEGVVAYSNNNSTTTAPVVKNDGSIQIATVIESASAPLAYVYELNLPAGAEIISSGSALLFVNGDEFVGGIAPAWAKDADGKDVPTRFEVSGTSVTQIVEHRSEEYSYPIVADPWIGIALFSRITVDSYNSQPRVNLDLSSWGWAVWSGAAQGGGLMGFGAGQAILNTAGWDEAWGRGGTIRSALDKPSQRQQFSCHALGALFAGTWNLEKFRPSRTNGDWGFGVAVHHCNWATANRY